MNFRIMALRTGCLGRFLATKPTESRMSRNWRKMETDQRDESNKWK